MIAGFYETNNDLLDESAHSELMSVLLPACASAWWGRYSIKSNFSMSDDWKLTVYVRKDGLDYAVEKDSRHQWF